MRLLNTQNLTFREFEGAETPSYSILSHRWGPDETSFQEFSSHRRRQQQRQGVRKVERYCQFARTRNFQWVWVDTCCINKESSAELSAAINSMWAWYRDAEECHVFLSDVPVVQQKKGVYYNKEKKCWTMSGRAFNTLRNSSWFVRGWTLQELLAPWKVIFCNDHWAIIGTKDGLADALSSITGVGVKFLRHQAPLNQASIAMKMSWASGRTTTKLEDMAYCLLGLFDVNMPLLYGEGRKAFMRLQQEIIKQSDDESIFAWLSNDVSSGMFADWPSAFRYSGNIISFRIPSGQRLPYSLTNKGLELRLPSITLHEQNANKVQSYHSGYTPVMLQAPSNRHVKFVQLACGRCDVKSTRNLKELQQQARHRVIGLKLQREGDAWQRVECDQLAIHKEFEIRRDDVHSVFYIPQNTIM